MDTCLSVSLRNSEIAMWSIVNFFAPPDPSEPKLFNPWCWKITGAILVLFGIVGIESADHGPQGADAVNNRRTPAPIA